jgi:predicted negative regulator of RcsB-dependent stress response
MTDTPAAPTKDNQTPADAAPAPLVGAAEFEFQVRTFWEKNRNFVYGVIAVALLAVLGREGWQWFAASREQDTQAAYARAGDQADKLAAFAAAHGGHPLAGAALLRVADQKFEAGDFKTAGENYTKAASTLPAGLTQARARLGAAMSQASAGDKAGAETALSALANDTAQPATLRAEASYHLAAVQAAQGRKDAALKSIEQISKIELNSGWARRGAALRLTLEGPAKPAENTPATGGLTLKPKG